ncbi:AAA family ATPase [Demequina sp.]|uniref:AAA family ATPase n=1 Tax=Demequina sp. TaxID=2050685 RepID=UPI003D12203C
MTLYVLTGLPGSGKSTHAATLAAATGAAHVAMDDEVMARGLSLVDYESRFALQPEVEARIAGMLADGHDVIAEFGSWTREERDRLRELAGASGGRTELHFIDASVETCAARVRARGGLGSEELARDVVEGSSHLYDRPSADEVATYDHFEHITT